MLAEVPGPSYALSWRLKKCQWWELVRDTGHPNSHPIPCCQSRAARRGFIFRKGAFRAAWDERRCCHILEGTPADRQKAKGPRWSKKSLVPNLQMKKPGP